MSTIESINAQIISQIAEINANYPELAKYLNEMPVTIPNEDDPEVNKQALKDYYKSINLLLKKYMAK